MLDKDKFLEYINNNFNIDVITYNLISEIYDIFKFKTKKIIEILNNCRIDITYEELYEKNIFTEETYFYDKQYEKMKKWIYSATEKELEEHYDWYKVEKGDKEDLLNTMYESYCDTFDKEELEERCNMLLEV